MNSQICLVLIFFLGCSVSSCAFRQGYNEGLSESKETYLRSHLSAMRDGIAKYTKDKGRPPQSLNELVDTGYISHIPRDPVTNELDWVVVLYDCSASANCKQGIKDLHSASTAKSPKGSLYSDW
jgi:general secretion pathway protein G